MPVDHRERAFESAIEHHLLTHGGYTKTQQAHFDQARALDTTQLVPFLKETQPEAWEALTKLHGDSTEIVVLDDLGKALDSRGSLDVLRHGFKCYGKLLRIAYFAPAHGMNPETQRQYAANRLTVTRQLLFSAGSSKSLDMVLGLNGVPVATLELKNPMTGQTVENAKYQYCNDRDPNELIFQFKKRALVHFAVDPDLVYMTTRLAGKSTRFLPFNKGNKNGAGNPDRPASHDGAPSGAKAQTLIASYPPAEAGGLPKTPSAEAGGLSKTDRADARLAGEDARLLRSARNDNSEFSRNDNSEFSSNDNTECSRNDPGGYKTAYLWEEVLERDSFLDILHRFIHLEVEEREIGGRLVRRETMVFPRYHQLDAVRKLEAAAQAEGPGHNYLVMHSAGSGKSNSIAWLAHRLASLHGRDDQRVFDSVVVVTDRRVLDQQLQNTIYQFEHKSGVVVKIDEDSTQLAEALKNATPIIITTLQKFPFITDKIGALPNRRYAVIVDEAHSSQSGEAAADLRGALAADAIQQKAKQEAEALGLPDYEEEILKAVARRGKQPNLSFFAFTATPKHKTLATFGRAGADGKPVPFHLYSMRQAIEEGFILDVLKNYTTYKRYFGLIKSIENDPKLDKSKAARALARFVSFHPYNIAQKTEVMIEHFRTFTKHKIGGKAKAMVVTSSREAAVRYKQEFDRYIAEKGYTDIKTLVAFSGSVALDMGDEYTEVAMNKGIKERELPERFAGEEYQVLIVAEKYQTGFDQPLLHTMYVDKRLGDVQAVQTLSRLNRTHPFKEETFVLDFVNERDDVLEAFKPYYEAAAVDEMAGPSQLYELQHKLAAEQVYHGPEVEAFCRIFFKPKISQTPGDHGLINAAIDPAVTRFRALEPAKQEQFKGLLIAFRNLYAFLAQIIPFTDTDLEKLYTFVRFLIAKLPKGMQERLELDDEVQLKYYRLQKISEGAISLTSGESGTVSGPTAVGTGGRNEEVLELSRLIDILNERFGTEFKPHDQLFFDQVRERAVADSALQQAALANTMDNFKFPLEKAIEGLFIDSMDGNEELFARYMNDKEFKKIVGNVLLRQVYQQIRAEHDQHAFVVGR